jgi:uncharacterized protein YukE
MERIRVDTAELKSKSKVFATSAGLYAQAGDEILGFVARLPGYDGQLSGPARAAAAEINRQCKDLYTAYKGDADSLVRIAQAFEEADNQAVTAINESLAAFSGVAPEYVEFYSPAPVTKIQGGNKTLGYKYLSNNVVEIWYQGRKMTIDLNAVSPDDWQRLMDFIKNIDTFDTILAGFPGELKDIIEGAFFTLVGVLTAGVLVETILGAIAGGVLIGKGLFDMGTSGNDIYENSIKITDAFNNSGDEFNNLLNSQDPGIQVLP